jgi:hypothetical protein
VLVELPGDKGFAEITNSQPEKGRGSAQGRPPTQVIVYFLGRDLKARSPAMVSGVSVQLTTVTDRPETLALEPSPGSRDPLGEARFASKSGPYYLTNSQGELSATVDGQPFRATFEGAEVR